MVNDKGQIVDTSELGNLKPEKVKIVVGITGKMDSAVVAFLLKKQGFNVIGVGISLWGPEIKSEKWSDFAKFCSVEDMDNLKGVCDKIGIPFYAVNAQSEYYDRVMRPTISASLSGEQSSTCFLCHKFKMGILFEKMELLKADFLATGHYAKIYKNHSSGEFNIFSASDRENDQSEYITEIEHNILSRLVLPLSELKKSEVEKLAKNFNLPFLKNIKTSASCYVDHKSYSKYIESRTHQDFREIGMFMDANTEKSYGEHRGVYQYRIGQSNLTLNNEKAISNSKLKIVRIDGHNNMIFVEDSEDQEINGAQIIDIKILKEMDLTRPTSFYMKSDGEDRKIPITIAYKNNGSAYLRFREPMQQLVPGTRVTLYNQQGAAAKVIMAGTVGYVGDMIQINRMQETHEDKDGNWVDKPADEFQF